MDSLIIPIVLYGPKIWGLSLLESDWAMTERVQVLMLCRIIKCKRTTPHAIVQVEFVDPPFKIETSFGLVSSLN